MSGLKPSHEEIETALDSYARSRKLDRKRVTASTGAILKAPYIACEELVQSNNLQRDVLSKIDDGEYYYWIFATYYDDVPLARIGFTCEGQACRFTSHSNGPSIRSAMYDELIQFWGEQRNAMVILLGCSNCMSLIHIPEVDETNLTPISDGCAPMVEENYPTIRKSQLEIYLSQFEGLSGEQQELKILEFFSDDTPGLSKTQLQQSTLNKLTHVRDIRENIMKHHEIYNR